MPKEEDDYRYRMKKRMTDQERLNLVEEQLETRGFNPLPEDFKEKLTVDQLAEALYEGTPHLQDLAEKLARQYSPATTLTFFQMQGDIVKAFWRDIATQLIDHAKEWEENEGSCCILSKREIKRLKRKYFRKKRK